ncbi:hypothetical protein AVEN_128693-1 [Araneus ventricosus]|uniref:Uncharacterized protein n=1 Tax=Araneus ventricosus TaxID=182803 RepID=A0A4Y2X7I5_ARAVE|nr:hypothetical protein AVEN_128693-1 [Araneus ventricosus]
MILNKDHQSNKDQSSGYEIVIIMQGHNWKCACLSMWQTDAAEMIAGEAMRSYTNTFRCADIVDFIFVVTLKQYNLRCSVIILKVRIDWLTVSPGPYSLEHAWNDIQE